MKLETGKYYLGSDGKKYGPVEPFEETLNGNWHVHTEGFLWEVNGTGVGNPNLIAEWDAQEPTSTSHFTHMLSDLQGIAAEYGYTIVETSGGENSLCVDIVRVEL